MTAPFPDRRQAIGGAAAIALTPTAGAAAQAASRPNILFILADDLGYADLGCYGAREIRTPVLDRLAAEGVRMTQAYANSAVCSATRTALITGRYQDRLPVGLEEPIPGYSPTLGLPSSHPTLPSLLRGRGYETALIGKWHLGAPPAFGPLKSGYEHFFGFYQGAADYFTYSDEAPGAPPAPYDGVYDGDRRVAPEGYLTDVLADHAVARLRARQGERPFFISLHFNAPHWPWEGPGDQAKSATLKRLRDYDGGSLAKYAEMVADMDAAIGRVLEAVRRTPGGGNTIVVFTSDNGGERFSQVWPFIGMKGELLEGGLRVPAIVRWPGRLPAGRVCDQTAMSMDWLPTLLAAAGGAPDPAYPSDGRDIGTELAGRPASPRSLFWRYRANDQAAARSGDWKYLRLAGKEHLFNVVADAHERAEQQDAHPEIFSRLKAEWTAWDAAMLPYPPKSFSETPKGRLVDRY